MHIYVMSQVVVVTQAFFTASDQYESETRFCGCDFQFRFEKKDLKQLLISLLRRRFSWLRLRLVLRYISLHFTWWILEQERSRWAKERRQERAKARKRATPMRTICITKCSLRTGPPEPVRRLNKVRQSVTSEQKVIFIN